MASEDEITEVVDEIATDLAEPIENRAIDLGMEWPDLLDRVVTEVKSMITGYQQ